MTERASQKLAILAPTDYAQFPAGGTKAFLAEFLHALPCGVAKETTLVGLTSGGTSAAGLEERRFGSNTYPFLRLGTLSGAGTSSVRLSFLRLVWSSWGQIRELGADTLYVHNVETAALCAVRGYTGRLVLHCHGIDNPMRLGRFARMRGGPPAWIYDQIVLPFAVRQARHVFVTAGQEDVLRFGERYRSGRQIDQVPAIIDGLSFAPQDRCEARRQLGLSEESVVGIVVGRLERSKGVHTVVDAFFHLKDEGLNAQLVIVGDGSFRADLEHRVESLGLLDRVHFLGTIERSRLPWVLSAADVYLSGSWREGFSMALVEALACGVPAVVTEAGAADEVVIDGKNGYTVPIGNSKEMAMRFKMAAAMHGRIRDLCIASVAGYRPGVVVRTMLPALGFRGVA